MTKATPGKWHRAYTENGDVDVTQKIPGMQNVQSPVINDGKSNGKGGKPECTIPLCKERHYWTSKDGKKLFEKILTFFCQACRSTRIQAVSRYFGPEEGKIMVEGLWKNDEVLLQEKRQSVTFAIEGCRRDLNGASGQTAL